MSDLDKELDEILGQLLSKASVEFMSHPDGKRIVMPAEELHNYQAEAKAKILALIKEARIEGLTMAKYVVEEDSTAEKLIDNMIVLEEKDKL